jgi:hypothetical protein
MPTPICSGANQGHSGAVGCSRTGLKVVAGPHSHALARVIPTVLDTANVTSPNAIRLLAVVTGYDVYAGTMQWTQGRRLSADRFSNVPWPGHEVRPYTPFGFLLYHLFRDVQMHESG